MGKKNDFLPPPLSRPTFEQTFRAPPRLPANASPPGAATIVTWLDVIDQAMCGPEQPPLIRELAQMLIQDVLNGYVPPDTLLNQVSKTDGTEEPAVPHTSWLDIIDEILSELPGAAYTETIEEAHAIVQGVLHKHTDVKCLLYPVAEQKKTPTFQASRISNDLTDDDIFRAVEDKLALQLYRGDYFDPVALSFRSNSLLASTIHVDLYYRGAVSEEEVTQALNMPPIVVREDNIPPLTQTIVIVNPIRV